ncbi:hypothetical protein [Candidatus Amarobacter glycogenicus]|uniref:hypothetical protein n=1 Tax=Candidatus Amarobacter glycogenicus TaxID=3140699 RepID=UPI002A0AE471|nr:hypothetical protein [Dehalococcoidia bacterium]
MEHNSADSQLAQIHLQRYAPHILLDVLPSAAAALQQLPLSALEPGPWDILLLDYRLPGLNALDVLKIIHDERFRFAHHPDHRTGQRGWGHSGAAGRCRLSGQATGLSIPAPIRSRKRLPPRPINPRTGCAAEKARRASGGLAENAQDIIFRLIVKLTAQFDYVGPAAQAITGYSPKEF